MRAVATARQGCGVKRLSARLPGWFAGFFAGRFSRHFFRHFVRCLTRRGRSAIHGRVLCAFRATRRRDVRKIAPGAPGAVAVAACRFFRSRLGFGFRLRRGFGLYLHRLFRLRGFCWLLLALWLLQRLLQLLRCLRRCTALRKALRGHQSATLERTRAHAPPGEALARTAQQNPSARLAIRAPVLFQTRLVGLLVRVGLGQMRSVALKNALCARLRLLNLQAQLLGARVGWRLGERVLDRGRAPHVE